jgi:hypothetical protein
MVGFAQQKFTFELEKSLIPSPSNSRATKRRRSSMTEVSLHGIDTSQSKKPKSVTHVSGTFCHPSLRPGTLKRTDGPESGSSCWSFGS